MDKDLAEMRRALVPAVQGVARGWRVMADAALAEMGVSDSAGWCLVTIDRLGPDPTQAELAEAIGIAPPSLVRTIDRLQAAGLVERSPHPDDGRAKIVALTPTGSALAGRIEERLETMREALMKDVPDGVIELALWLLDTMTHRIERRRGGVD
ncbi:MULTISPECIES: MarR family winged helix-turn-helix transcriptional regulator [unclassified Sphingobium]|uniref:MarR family winged helix-turn-helix transcriptional regulator n=1 Tax=unclassified Sphingobium TaxID=2611147 RepID=UPI0035A64DC3